MNVSETASSGELLLSLWSFVSTWWTVVLGLWACDRIFPSGKAEAGLEPRLS